MYYLYSRRGYDFYVYEIQGVFNIIIDKRWGIWFKYNIITFNRNTMRLRQELIEQLRNGEAAVKGNGRCEDDVKLKEIIQTAFSHYKGYINNIRTYYALDCKGIGFPFSNNTCDKTYEIDDFFEEEFNPQFGDEVMVSQDNEKWYKRYYVGNYKGINYCVFYDDNFLKQTNFYTNQWKYIKPLKEEEEVVHLTLKDISNGKGVGVPPHLIRVKQ